ncbi:cellulose biosynthesis protein BcsR [Erwinia amylovora]
MGEHSSQDLPVSREAQDDIRALGAAFSLQNWHYIDIARQERLAGIITRWPLLAEFATDINKGR